MSDGGKDIAEAVNWIIFSLGSLFIFFLAIILWGTILASDDRLSWFWFVRILMAVGLTILLLYLVSVNYLGKRPRWLKYLGFKTKRPKDPSAVEELYYQGRITKEEYEEWQEEQQRDSSSNH